MKPKTIIGVLAIMAILIGVLIISSVVNKAAGSARQPPAQRKKHLMAFQWFWSVLPESGASLPLRLRGA